MKQERLNSEKKIPNDIFNIKIGTINKKRPSVIYLDGSTFISPLLDKEDYTDDVKEIKCELDNIVKNALRNSKLFEKNFIGNFDVRLSGIRKEKKSYLSFQYHLKQPKNNIMTLNYLKDNSNNIIDNIVNSLKNILLAHNFELSKHKK